MNFFQIYLIVLLSHMVQHQKIKPDFHHQIRQQIKIIRNTKNTNKQSNKIKQQSKIRQNKIQANQQVMINKKL